MTNYKINEMVKLIDTECADCLYEIMRIEKGDKIEVSNYVFGYDNYNFPISKFYGKYELILAEYSKDKKFIKNIATTFDNIEKI